MDNVCVTIGHRCDAGAVPGSAWDVCLATDAHDEGIAGSGLGAGGGLRFPEPRDCDAICRMARHVATWLPPYMVRVTTRVHSIRLWCFGSRAGHGFNNHNPRGPGAVVEGEQSFSLSC